MLCVQRSDVCGFRLSTVLTLNPINLSPQYYFIDTNYLAVQDMVK
jgi:hypothetical protein